MLSIRLEPITEEGFAPFGLVLRTPELGRPRLELCSELANLREAAKPRLTLATAPPRSLPFAAVQMERHVHSSQTFVPIDCADWMVLVAPHGADDLPDLERARAFRVPGDVGAHYFADVWHHPLSPLERPCRFVVLTFVDGGPEDDQFVDLPRRMEIAG